jgi:hypothetical protein
VIDGLIQFEDYKSTWTMYDLSTQHDNDGIVFTIFWPEEKIPQVNAGDVALLLKVKVSIAVLVGRETPHGFAGSQIQEHPTVFTCEPQLDHLCIFSLQDSQAAEICQSRVGSTQDGDKSGADR